MKRKKMALPLAALCWVVAVTLGAFVLLAFTGAMYNAGFTDGRVEANRLCEEWRE